MHALLRQLNPAQRDVVRHYRGPLLVSAVAGSGKTTAMCRRIAYLVRVRKVDPRSILATTFTRKAAAHMNAKLEELGVKGVRVGTLHSVAYEILRKDGRDDERFQGRFKLKKKVRLPPSKWLVQKWGVLESVLLDFVGWCKNWLISPQAAAAATLPPAIVEYLRRANLHGETGLKPADLAEAYRRYERLRVKQRVLTYDDVLYQGWLLLRDSAPARAKWQARYHFIIIDEVQDTCRAQHEIIRLLAGPRRNLVVVGDVDQSIYSWRAAVPQFMLDFAAQYKAPVIYMNRNYRSVPAICTAAAKLIEHNTQRLEARLEATRAAAPAAAMTLTALRELDDEQDFIARTLEASHTRYAWRDMAVLCRTNATAQSLEHALLARNIPYRLVSSISLLDRKIVTTVVDYLRVGRALYRGKFDLAAAAATINLPRRGVGAAYLRKLDDLLQAGELSVEEALLKAGNKRQREHVDGYLDLLHRIAALIRQRESPAKILPWISAELGLPQYLNPDNPKKQRSAQHSIDDLAKLARQPSCRSFLRWYDEAMLFDDDLDLEGAKAPDQVFVGTIHRAKGLEFGVVMIPQVVERKLPHMMAGADPAGIEEERRLAYVAVTRAKDRALLSYTDFGRGHVLQYPSRFLTEFGFKPGGNPGTTM